MKRRACLVLLLLMAAVSAAEQLPLSIIVTPSRGEAETTLAALRGGADFAATARSVSIDPTASSGGYLGMVDSSSLRSELGAALAGVKPGDLSPIVKIPSGFAILKILP